MCFIFLSWSVWKLKVMWTCRQWGGGQLSFGEKWNSYRPGACYSTSSEDGILEWVMSVREWVSPVSVPRHISETVHCFDFISCMILRYILGMVHVYLEFWKKSNWLIFGAFCGFLKLLFIKVFLFDLSCRISIMLYKPRIFMTWVTFRGHDLLFQGQLRSRTWKFSFSLYISRSFRHCSLNFIHTFPYSYDMFVMPLEALYDFRLHYSSYRSGICHFVVTCFTSHLVMFK